MPKVGILKTTSLKFTNKEVILKTHRKHKITLHEHKN